MLYVIYASFGNFLELFFGKFENVENCYRKQRLLQLCQHRAVVAGIWWYWVSM